MLECLDGANGTVCEPCDIEERIPFDKPKEDDFALVGREECERLKCKRLVERGIFDTLVGEVGSLCASLSPQPVDAAMPGDRQQPAGDRATAVAIAPDAFERFEEDLSGDVFRYGPVSHLGKYGTKDQGVVLFEETCPGSRLAPSQPIEVGLGDAGER